MKIFFQSLVILLSSLTAFVIANTPVFPYTPVFLAILILIALFYVLYKWRRKKGQEILSGANKEIYIILLGVLLVILYTGGIKSVLFFLVYFLLFGITFIFEPTMIILFLACLTGLFLPSTIKDDVFGNIVKLSSLILLTPIAFFFGREYKKREKLQISVQQKTDTIMKDAEDIIKTKDKNEKLKMAEEIITEARELQKETE